MTTIADAPDNTTVAQLTQTVADLEEPIEEHAERIDTLERRLAHHREARVITMTLGLERGGDKR